MEEKRWKQECKKNKSYDAEWKICNSNEDSFSKN